LGKQRVQADEVVIDLEGRTKDSSIDGIRILVYAQTSAPPNLDVTIVQVAGATTDRRFHRLRGSRQPRGGSASARSYSALGSSGPVAAPSELLRAVT
jgi:hypothetical protein